MSNYQAIIARVDAVSPIQGADNIHAAFVLGETCVVSKHVNVGDVGILFLCGTQLTEEFLKNNNLYRHKEKNLNPDVGGFFEDNGKVKAVRLRGVNSAAFFCGLHLLQFTNADIASLKVGDKFSSINDIEICRKFIVKANKVKGDPKDPKFKVKLKSYPLFKEHVETNQYNQNKHLIKNGDIITIQAKKHGTSQRLSFTKVVRALKPWQYKVNRWLPIFKTDSWEYMTGTRRVVLDKPGKDGFHGSEQFRFDIADKLKPYISKGMTLYFEVVGYANNKPIMSVHKTAELKDKKLQKKYGDEIVYKYGCQEGTNDFYIYRITLTTEDGTDIDFTQKQVVEWCTKRGFKPSHDLIPPFVYKGDIEALDALVYDLTERPDLLCEDYTDPSHINEGVIIRCDGGNTTPVFLKSKSFYFKVLEGIAQELEPDIEDNGGTLDDTITEQP